MIEGFEPLSSSKFESTKDFMKPWESVEAKFDTSFDKNDDLNTSTDSMFRA